MDASPVLFDANPAFSALCHILIASRRMIATSACLVRHLVPGRRRQLTHRSAAVKDLVKASINVI